MPGLGALFERLPLGGVPLRNRIGMAPMTRSFCGPQGLPDAAVARYYAARAAAGTGLLITEGTVVDMEAARGYRGVPGLCDHAQEAAWRVVTPTPCTPRRRAHHGAALARARRTAGAPACHRRRPAAGHRPCTDSRNRS
ncbi:MAG: hypothetical protein Kow0073_06490 [Immundisolibacter sp.]